MTLLQPMLNIILVVIQDYTRPKNSGKKNIDHQYLEYKIFFSCAFVFCCLTFSVPLFRWLEHDGCYGCCVCFFVFSLFSLSLVHLTRSH